MSQVNWTRSEKIGVAVLTVGAVSLPFLFAGLIWLMAI